MLLPLETGDEWVKLISLPKWVIGKKKNSKALFSTQNSPDIMLTYGERLG